MEKRPWYRLDNAALIYSAIQKEEYSAVYRFSAVMTAPVDPAALQRAVDRTLPRFPLFRTRIRRGAFWYYLEPNDAPGPFVKPDVSNCCQPVRFKEDGGWLVRFYWYDRRISFEAFHALADGAGALVFFRTLLAVYLRETGIPIPDGEGIPPLEEPPPAEETEDAYARYAGKGPGLSMNASSAYQALGTPEPFYTFHVTMGFVPLDKLRQVAKSYGASVTEYLSAVLIQVLLDKQARQRPHKLRPVALAVPVNLRPYFPSRTLRNFILTLRPAIDPNLGEYSFREIIDQVHYYMRLHSNPQELRAQFTRNVRFQRNRLLQVVPVWVKDLILSQSYSFVGTRPYSATLTNPGPFRVPAAMAPHIRHMEVILGQSYVPRMNCACISYGNLAELTFAGTVKETDVERDFFRRLVQEGIPVKVISNRERRE